MTPDSRVLWCLQIMAGAVTKAGLYLSTGGEDSIFATLMLPGKTKVRVFKVICVRRIPR